MEEAVEGSEALVVLTEWPEYQNMNFKALRASMPTERSLFFDFRSFIDQEVVREGGFESVFKLGTGLLK